MTERITEKLIPRTSKSDPTKAQAMLVRSAMQSICVYKSIIMLPDCVAKGCTMKKSKNMQQP